MGRNGGHLVGQCLVGGGVCGCHGSAVGVRGSSEILNQSGTCRDQGQVGAEAAVLEMTTVSGDYQGDTGAGSRLTIAGKGSFHYHVIVVVASREVRRITGHCSMQSNGLGQRPEFSGFTSWAIIRRYFGYRKDAQGF